MTNIRLPGAAVNAPADLSWYIGGTLCSILSMQDLSPDAKRIMFLNMAGLTRTLYRTVVSAGMPFYLRSVTAASTAVEGKGPRSGEGRLKYFQELVYRGVINPVPQSGRPVRGPWKTNHTFTAANLCLVDSAAKMLSPGTTRMIIQPEPSLSRFVQEYSWQQYTARELLVFLYTASRYPEEELLSPGFIGKISARKIERIIGVGRNTVNKVLCDFQKYGQAEDLNTLALCGDKAEKRRLQYA